MARPEHRRFNSASVQHWKIAAAGRRSAASAYPPRAAKSVQYRPQRHRRPRSAPAPARHRWNRRNKPDAIEQQQSLIISGSGISLTDLTATGTLSTTTRSS